MDGRDRMQVVTHALTFDIEDWFHLIGIPATADVQTWDSLPSLIDRRTDQILRICEHHGVLGTFFVLGWVAERRPKLVRRLIDAGHEVGSHSYWHRPLHALSVEEFRRDLRDSIAVLEAAGARVRGYRAPAFSITRQAEWALTILAREGIRYDASLVSDFRQDRSGLRRLGPHWIDVEPGLRIAELPMSTTSAGIGRARARVCYSGGAYFRLLPRWAIQAGLRREAAQGRGTVVYLHPRDFAPDCPRVRMPLNRRIRTYAGATTAERKLDHVLRTYRFTTCATLLDETLSTAGTTAC